MFYHVRQKLEFVNVAHKIFVIVQLTECDKYVLKTDTSCHSNSHTSEVTPQKSTKTCFVLIQLKKVAIFLNKQYAHSLTHDHSKIQNIISFEFSIRKTRNVPKVNQKHYYKNSAIKTYKQQHHRTSIVLRS